MSEELVSIVSPSYNGAKYLDNFLNSILLQDYSNLELLFIDDGSTDNTKEIVKSYEGKFDNKGFKLRYFYQKNKGQAAAINVGLENYSGEYFMWIDSDDILYSNSVSKKLDYLKNNKECAFVFSMAEYVEEKDINNRICVAGRKAQDVDNLFSDYIYCRNILFVPGSVLVRSFAVKECFKDGGIFESREGQNWQLMLPLAYNYKCGYMDDVLMKIVIHTNSHSRKERTYKQEVNRNNGFYTIIKNTVMKIKTMPIDEKNYWIEKVKIIYGKKTLDLAVDNGDIFLSFKMYIKLKRLNEQVSTSSIILAIKQRLAQNKILYKFFIKNRCN